jgi:2,3-bisphosphoglycerate-independent phosphoglycerate mutase
MDRDSRWERTRRAYDAIVRAAGTRASTASEAVAAAYARDEGDEFIAPTVLDAAAPMVAGDVAIHLNFRADRARQLAHALADLDFAHFARRNAAAMTLATLTEYESPDELEARVAFPPVVADSLAAHLARLGKRQLHVAETEKYAHVTYFFNGGIEAPFDGEDRLLVPSDRSVATYDLAPEMRAEAITDALVAALDAGDHDFIVANYANPDMVGHTGVWTAAVRAAEVIDGCLGRLARAALGTDSPMIVTADHGNIEEMRDADGNPQTKHTTSPVPLVLVSLEHREARLSDGILADVAPTLCELMGIPPGPEMTGRSLIAAGSGR